MDDRGRSPDGPAAPSFHRKPARGCAVNRKQKESNHVRLPEKTDRGAGLQDPA